LDTGTGIVIAAILVLLAAGIYTYTTQQNQWHGDMGGMMSGGMMGNTPAPGYAVPEKTEFRSNGEMLYYTGASRRGTKMVPSEGGPMWLYMHGGSCVNCHGEDGRGGEVMMCTEEAPDIRYSVLTSGMVHDGEKEEPYTSDEQIKRAITQGINQEGEELDPCMPRWNMTQEDLNDLISYLKELDARSQEE